MIDNIHHTAASSPGFFTPDPIKIKLGYTTTAVSRCTTRSTHISGWGSVREGLAEAVGRMR